MLVEFIDYSLRYLGLETFKVVYMSGDIQVHSTGWLVALDELVPTEWVIVGIDVLEGLWRSDLPRIPEGMSRNVVLLQEVLLQLGSKVIESSPGVCILRVSTCALWWNFMGAEKRVACSAGIETRVYMEEIVSLYDDHRLDAFINMIY